MMSILPAATAARGLSRRFPSAPETDAPSRNKARPALRANASHGERFFAESSAE
jgi:hypothetical protein